MLESAHFRFGMVTETSRVKTAKPVTVSSCQGLLLGLQADVDRTILNRQGTSWVQEHVVASGHDSVTFFGLNEQFL